MPGARPANNQVKVNVLAAERWQPFGEVHAGDVLVFTAEGTWSANVKLPAYTVGPNGGPIAGGRWGQLVGRVGDKGPTFEIGLGTTYAVPADGFLQMQMNDFYYFDNRGQLTVTVEKK